MATRPTWIQLVTDHFGLPTDAPITDVALDQSPIRNATLSIRLVKTLTMAEVEVLLAAQAENPITLPPIPDGETA